MRLEDRPSSSQDDAQHALFNPSPTTPDGIATQTPILGTVPIEVAADAMRGWQVTGVDTSTGLVTLRDATGSIKQVQGYFQPPDKDGVISIRTEPMILTSPTTVTPETCPAAASGVLPITEVPKEAVQEGEWPADFSVRPRCNDCGQIVHVRSLRPLDGSCRKCRSKAFVVMRTTIWEQLAFRLGIFRDVNFGEWTKRFASTPGNARVQ